ncbi:hypothetical protein SARC_11453, partial [Sphaeroforma arctica JP610]
MGLGKTLQTIALLGTLKMEYNIGGPHLVVVPMSVLSNWMTEFKRFCPSLKTLRYHTASDAEKALMRKEIAYKSPRGLLDVVVTTYEVVAGEFRRGRSGLFSQRWRYVVVDEAHKVKNHESQISMACRTLTRNHTLFLTGTPLQNNLSECWALLHCMQPDIFQKADVFDNAFDASDVTTTDLALVDHVWQLLKLLVLRRRKKEIDLALPPKRELRLLCPLSEQQSFWYKRLLLAHAHHLASNGHDTEKAADEEGEGREPLPKLSNLMMQLRKVCIHPFLFKGAEPDAEDTTADELAAASGKLRMMDRLLVKLKAEGHRAVIFSQFTQMLDLLEDFLYLKGYRFVRLDGGTNRIQRMINIGQFNAPGSVVFVFLLSTRAGGLGVNLQTADTCILYDSDWNPQADLQAMARVHRIGQTKPVTIYRMIMTGSVEERIVARAQRKLMLDELVSHGSESVFGKRSDTTTAETANESTMRRALRFTMKQMFKRDGGAIVSMDKPVGDDVLSDENLDNLIEQARNQTEDMIADRDAEAAELEEDDPNDNCFAAVADSHIKKFDNKVYTVSEIYKGASLKSIRQEWDKKKLVLSGKRERVDRCVMVDGGAGLGKRVAVLRNTQYDISKGLPGVYDVGGELYGKALIPTPKKPSRLVAGRDYDNLDFCQCCGVSGDLVMCDGCPNSFHVSCLGYKNKAHFDREMRHGRVAMAFRCPHHECAQCGKSSVRAGNLLIRCAGCANAYCEDCADWDTLNVLTDQPPLLHQKLGFNLCRQAAYVHCSPACTHAYEQAEELYIDLAQPPDPQAVVVVPKDPTRKARKAKKNGAARAKAAVTEKRTIVIDGSSESADELCMDTKAPMVAQQCGDGDVWGFNKPSIVGKTKGKGNGYKKKTSLSTAKGLSKRKVPQQQTLLTQSTRQNATDAVVPKVEPQTKVPNSAEKVPSSAIKTTRTTRSRLVTPASQPGQARAGPPVSSYVVAQTEDCRPPTFLHQTRGSGGSAALSYAGQSVIGQVPVRQSPAQGSGRTSSRLRSREASALPVVSKGPFVFSKDTLVAKVENPFGMKQEGAVAMDAQSVHGVPQVAAAAL